VSAIVDQIVDDGDCTAILRAMADIYQRYGLDAVDVPAQPLPVHDSPVRVPS
jgi:hypothetical protein